MSLLAELKRRNVIRMAGLYLVGAWLIVQVAGTVLPMFGAPAWVPRSMVLVLAIGFVPALAFAWIFELTPDGLKRDVEINPAESIAPQTAQRMNRMIVAVLVLALGYFGFDKFVLAPKREAAMLAVARMQAAQTPAATADGKTIAVMPFLNMSGDASKEYFSDGMTEEILNALAKVPKLEVTARTSVFSLKGQRHDVREIGKMLGVAYLLEGSVRQAGDEVRITAQLIRTDNGFHLWSETYDRKLQNVFAVQAELAGAIAQALQLPLGMGGDDGLVTERTDNSQAYALYLQARAAYRARDMPRSIELLNAALALDPKFAPAWASLCGSKSLLQFYLPAAERAKIPQILEEAEIACKRAIELAPDLAAAQIMLANLYSNQWRWREAEEHYLRAQALAPNDPEFYFAYTDFLGSRGRTEEALAAAQRAVELDPMAPMYRNLYGYLLRYAGRPQECLAQMQAGYALAPSNVYLNQNLITCYVATGRIDDAEKLRDSLRNALVVRGESSMTIAKQLAIQDATIAIARHPDQYAAITKPLGEDGLVLALVFPTHVDELFDYAGQQIDQHRNGSDGVILLRSQLFANYRKDPRYLRLLHKAGFDDAGNIR
jgi:TolB-like protein